MKDLRKPALTAAERAHTDGSATLYVYGVDYTVDRAGVVRVAEYDDYGAVESWTVHHGLTVEQEEQLRTRAAAVRSAQP